MRFITIHDITIPETVEMFNEEGEVIGLEEVDTVVRKDVRTPIYLELEDIRMIMPYYSKKGRRYGNRTMVQTSSESYILNHSFDYLVNLKERRNGVLIGFKKDKAQ